MEKNFEKYSNKNGTIYHGDALDILSSNKHSKICLKEFAFSWLLCPVVLLHDWYLCGCWRYRNDDCTELWKMTIRLPLGFSLKSVGSFYVVPSEQIRPSVLTDTNVFFLFIHRHQPNLILRPL